MFLSEKLVRIIVAGLMLFCGIPLGAGTCAFKGAGAFHVAVAPEELTALDAIVSPLKLGASSCDEVVSVSSEECGVMGREKKRAQRYLVSLRRVTTSEPESEHLDYCEPIDVGSLSYEKYVDLWSAARIDLLKVHESVVRFREHFTSALHRLIRADDLDLDDGANEYIVPFQLRSHCGIYEDICKRYDRCFNTALALEMGSELIPVKHLSSCAYPKVAFKIRRLGNGVCTNCGTRWNGVMSQCMMCQIEFMCPPETLYKGACSFVAGLTAECEQLEVIIAASIAKMQRITTAGRE